MFRRHAIDEFGPREGGAPLPAGDFPLASTKAKTDRSSRLGIHLLVSAEHDHALRAVTISAFTPHEVTVDGLDKQRIGASLLLFLPGLQPKPATVAWSEPGRTGLEFDHPLHQSVYMRLVSEFAVVHHRRCAAGRAEAA